MLTNLLTTAADKYDYKMPIGETSINALVGFLVVFAGISFLILVIWLVGKFMTKGSAKPKKQSVAKVEPQKPVETPAPVEEGIDEETVAVIMAALAAYYETNKPKCEFTVKRIKRIRRNDYA